VPTTLADRLAQRDAERFVGRAAELALFETLFAGHAGPSVVLVHGPGGIGKSTLLRELARLAAVRGWSPWLIDGRELAPLPGELDAVFGAAREQQRPIVLLDS
jgi:predicted ATP-dependent serine protease